MTDPWNRNYPPGVRCGPCSARFPVGVHHPAERPCGHVDRRADAEHAARNQIAYAAAMAARADMQFIGLESPTTEDQL